MSSDPAWLTAPPVLWQALTTCKHMRMRPVTLSKQWTRHLSLPPQAPTWKWARATRAVKLLAHHVNVLCLAGRLCLQAAPILRGGCSGSHVSVPPEEHSAPSEGASRRLSSNPPWCLHSITDSSPSSLLQTLRAGHSKSAGMRNP